MPKTLRRNAVNLGLDNGSLSISAKCATRITRTSESMAWTSIARERRDLVERRRRSQRQHLRGHLKLCRRGEGTGWVEVS
jgi:hypothetical protein